MMKKVFASCLFLLGASVLQAQDVLTKRNGDELQVKVVKISADEVEYKKWSNPDGPSYVVPKAEVFMVKYQNGDKDVFDSAPAAKPAEASAASSAPVKAAPAADNAALIEEFNRVDDALFAAQRADRKDKEAGEWLGTLGVTKNSVLSSDEIQVSFFNEEKSCYYTPYEYKGEPSSGLNYFQEKFCVEILNKTSQTIYIDKANSFRIEPDGSYYVYYNSQQTTVNQGGASGGGVNLGAVTGALGIGGAVNTLAGGVSVGGKNDHSVSTTYADQRVVAIPPHGKMVLSKDKLILIKTNSWSGDEFKVVEFSEDFKNAKIPQLQKGEYKAFYETNSPATKRYMLAYSTDPEFKSSKQLEFSMYIREVIGVGTTWKYFVYDGLDEALEKLSGQKGYSTKSILVGGRFF